MIHLDTTAAIALLNDRQRIVRDRFEAARRADSITLSMTVYYELTVGAAAGARRHDNEEKIALFIATTGMTLLPFEEPDARGAAEIRAHLRKLGAPIGPYDALIAAQARRAAGDREWRRV